MNVNQIWLMKHQHICKMKISANTFQNKPMEFTAEMIAGLLGATMSIEMGLVGAFGFIIAIVISQGFGAVFGYGYGKLLNRVKGGEMMISTYVGFSSVMLMSIASSI